MKNYRRDVPKSVTSFSENKKTGIIYVLQRFDRDENKQILSHENYT